MTLDVVVGHEDQAGFGIIPRYLRGKVTAYEIAVYVALTWRVNPQGTCFMTQRRLAEEAGCSLNTAIRALQSLRDKGLVEWQPIYNEDGSVKCNQYQLGVFSHRVGGSPSQGGGVTLTGRDNETPLTKPHEELMLTEADATVRDPFDEWWGLYPRKTSKARAKVAYQAALRKSGVTPQVLLAALAKHLPALQASEKRFVPHATTWLNQERWDDVDVLDVRDVRPGNERERKAAEIADFNESLKTMTLDDLNAMF